MKIRKLIIVVVVLVLLGGYAYMNPILPIITGYSAKNLSSGVFVANRTQESIEATDLNFSFIKYVKNKVDWENKTVKSSFLWHTSKTIYVDGFGCLLINDYTKEEIANRPYSIVEPIPANPDTIPWPMGDVISDTIPAGIDMEKLKLAVEQAFVDTVPFKGTFALMVVYKGQPIVEKYKDGLGPDNKFLSWSMAKSFTNALTGILVKEGKMKIDKPIGLEAWTDDKRNTITIGNLLNMNSGLEWNENYGNNSDVNNMLHKEGDMAEFTFNKNLISTPGTLWLYSSGTTNVVSYLIRQTFDNDAAYYAFPRTELFNKIGMRSAVWEVDASGTFVGSSYIYASMRDYARFGLLYLNNGNWLGEQILPEGWVDYTTTEATGSDGQYGAFFWLNQSGTDYPDVPRDMYCARGHDGQYIYIIPSKELVVVRTGFSKKGQFDLNQFLADIVDAVE